jgi:hypothetical protein
MLSKRISTALLSGAAIAGLGATASAGLMVDVRATGATGGAVLVNNKLVNVANAAAGDTVTFDVFALVSGNNANPNDEGLVNVFGSYLSNGGGLRGNSQATVNPNFRASGFSNGFMQDLDGDGDLDVGSNTNGSATNYFNARVNTAPTPAPGPTHLIGSVTLTVSSLNASGGDTLFNYRPRFASTAGSWFEDGSATGTAQQGASSIQSGAPVVLQVPEPATLGLAAIAGLGLLARRRA